MKIPKLALVIVVVVVLAFFVRSCQGPNEKYWMRVAVHEQAMKDAAVAHSASLAEIAALQADNAAKVSENVTLKGTVVTQMGTIATLNATIAGLVAIEPPTTPEEEALPIVINLRAQIKSLREGFSLSQETIATQGKIIANLELVVKNTEKIALGWKTDYERSQGLLATERSLRIKAEKGWGGASVVAKVEAALIGGIGAYFGGKALGHTLKLW